MDMMNTCDNWVIVRIKSEDGSVAGWKVLTGTSGGYTTGDSWRINSGIKDYDVLSDHILFHGYSGSTYKCMKDSETVRMNIADVLMSLIKTGMVEQQSFSDFEKEFKGL